MTTKTSYQTKNESRSQYSVPANRAVPEKLAVPGFYNDGSFDTYTDNRAVFTKREITNYIERGDYDSDEVVLSNENLDNYEFLDGSKSEYKTGLTTEYLEDYDFLNSPKTGNVSVIQEKEISAPKFSQELQEILNRPVTVYANNPAMWEKSIYVDNKLVSREKKNKKMVPKKPMIERPYLKAKWKKSDYIATMPKKETKAYKPAPLKAKRALRGLKALLF